MNRRKEARCRRVLERATARAGVALCGHAVQRASELGFSVDEVLRAVTDAEQSYSCGPGYPPGRVMYQRGQVSVVVSGDSATVVTVLLRRGDQWVHGVDRRTPERPTAA